MPMIRLRPTNIILSLIFSISFLSTPFKANAATLFLGTGYDSVSMSRLSQSTEQFSGIPLLMGVQFESKTRTSSWSLFSFVQGEYLARSGDAQDKMNGLNFQIGGGIRYAFLFVKAGVHLGSQTVNEASGSKINFDDRGSHVSGGLEIKLKGRFSFQIEEQAAFISLFGTGDTLFSAAYAGQYFRTIGLLHYAL